MSNTITIKLESTGSYSLEEIQESAENYIKQLINSNEKKIIRTPGGIEGKFWMADDFDETPDCFEDYV